MAYNALNNLIDAYIYANGVQAITGQILNAVLKQMVSQLGSGYHLMGVAVPATEPAANDYAMAYFAATAGEYTEFGGITLSAGEVAVLLTYGNGSWSKETIYNVPTGTADLENTANFITNAVTDLVNYYTKTEVDDTLANYPTLEGLATALADYYDKTEVETLISSAGNGEDIDSNPAGKLQFANRTYNSQQPNGMGYKILRKNATFASQVTDTNTIYEIRYDFSLEGDPFALPNGCILRFNGGSINNGSLSNVGKTEGAMEGSITASITSFSNDIKLIRTSDYSVGINSAPAYNNSVFQAAIDKQIAIEIDSTSLGNLDNTDAITFDSPLRLTRIRVSIKGVGFQGGQLYFPNGDAFVYTERLYYSYNCFENLSIISKGWCFNFVNCETEGVVNTYRPYNIYKSVFRNLVVKSLEKDCFYQGGVTGYGGEAALLFQVLFSNINLWTPRYGFNGVLGSTDFIVEKLTDSYVPESFFYNTCPNVVRYVNSSFSSTKNFMRFGEPLANYGLSIRCEYCSFEGYTGEIFVDENFSSNTRVYNISLFKCSFAYYAATFQSGKVELFPIKLNRITWIRWKNTAEPTIGYENGYGIIRTQSHDNADTDKELIVFYGNSGGNYVGTFKVSPAISVKNAIIGAYPNYIAPIESDFFKGAAVMADNFGFNPQTIDVSTNRTPTINSSFIELTTTADTQVNYIVPAPLGQIGASLGSPYNKFGKFILLYNSSSYNITFNSGYGNSVVAEDTHFFVMRPKEFAIAVYDEAKTGNKFVVVKRLNAFLKVGETTKRPTLTAYEAGFTFYDRDLRKMILWNGSAWVNMDGTALA